MKPFKNNHTDGMPSWFYEAYMASLPQYTQEEIDKIFPYLNSGTKEIRLNHSTTVDLYQSFLKSSVDFRSSSVFNFFEDIHFKLYLKDIFGEIVRIDECPKGTFILTIKYTKRSITRPTTPPAPPNASLLPERPF